MKDLDIKIKDLKSELKSADVKVDMYRIEHTRLLEALELYREELAFHKATLREARRSSIANLSTYRASKDLIPETQAHIIFHKTKLNTIESSIKRELDHVKQLKNKIQALEKENASYGKVLQLRR